jgi:dTDP-glucose 4,6-dehydratase
MRVLVTGGAGFLGSHLCDALHERGDEVICADDLSTGREQNVAQLLGSQHFTLLKEDVSRREFPERLADVLQGRRLDAIVHLASAASPPEYLKRPLETLAVNSFGTWHMLEVAGANGARFVMASTSEVYGDPQVNPQPESYWGNVNPVGPRAVYDEGKRFSEALTVAMSKTKGVRGGIVRIFNTYGPRLAPADGRVVSNFLYQALTGRPLTVYGDGSQTRSLCYVSDLIAGLLAMIDSEEPGPVNLGNPQERSVLEIAHRILELTGSSSEIVFQPLPADDPTRRCPDISRAKERLGWAPVVELEAGIAAMRAWMEKELSLN